MACCAVGELWDAAWNSIRIVGLAALFCGFLGLLIGYVVVRGAGSRVSGFLRQVSFLPYLVPGIAFAAACLSLFAVRRGPIPALYGTITLLVLGADRHPSAVLVAVGHLGDDAARPGTGGGGADQRGAAGSTRMSRIIIPIQRGALVTGVVLPFISGLKELSIVIMLTTSGTQLLTTLSIGSSTTATPSSPTGSVLIIALRLFTMTYLAQRLTKSSLASGIGG